MFYYPITICLSVIDLFLNFYFFKSYQFSRNTDKGNNISIFDNKLIFLILLIPDLGTTLVQLHLTSTDSIIWFNMMSNFLSIFLSGVFFNIPLFTWIFLSISLQAIGLVSEGLTVFTPISPLFHSLDPYLSKLLTGNIVSVFYRNVIVIIVSFVFKYKKRISFPTEYILLFFPVISTVLLAFFLVNNNQLHAAFELKTVLVLIIAIAVNICFLIMYRKIRKDANEKNAYKEIINEIEAQNKYYEEIEKSQYQISLVEHDLKNKLTTIAGYLENEEYSEALLHIKKDIDFIEKNSLNLFAPNPVLNYLLSSKFKEAELNNIDFKIECFIPESLEISNNIIAIILGNLLDNAIHACQNMPDDAKKEIITKIKYFDDSLFIEITNTYDAQQEQAKPHRNGLGIKSVKKVIKDCDGIYKQWVENDFYYVNVILWDFREND